MLVVAIRELWLPNASFESGVGKFVILVTFRMSPLTFEEGPKLI